MLIIQAARVVRHARLLHSVVKASMLKLTAWARCISISRDMGGFLNGCPTKKARAVMRKQKKPLLARKLIKDDRLDEDQSARHVMIASFSR